MTNRSLDEVINLREIPSGSTTLALCSSPERFKKEMKNPAKHASDLIKAGKENGVKKMKIVMEDKIGAHLDAPILGTKISAGVSSEGKTTIEVEYA